MTTLVLFATAFVVRVVVGSVFPGPAYPDSYYYVHVAQQLAAGNGFAAELAAGLPFWLIGSLVAPPACWIARDAGFSDDPLCH